jgi:hypothetical protein
MGKSESQFLQFHLSDGHTVKIEMAERFWQIRYYENSQLSSVIVWHFSSLNKLTAGIIYQPMTEHQIHQTFIAEEGSKSDLLVMSYSAFSNLLDLKLTSGICLTETDQIDFPRQDCLHKREAEIIPTKAAKTLRIEDTSLKTKIEWNWCRDKVLHLYIHQESDSGKQLFILNEEYGLYRAKSQLPDGTEQEFTVDASSSIRSLKKSPLTLPAPAPVPITFGCASIHRRAAKGSRHRRRRKAKLRICERVGRGF